jgi:outer membrane lipoprotein LolB
MRRALRCGACALLLALAGCATHGAREAPPSSTAIAPAAAERTQDARRQWLATHRDWRVSGRVAISRGGKGGSGRLDWAQAGDAFTVSLSAPITKQSWRLTGDLAGGDARIEGLDGGPREGADAQTMLREATGWDVPVKELASWMTGIAAPGAAVDEQRYGDDGLLAHLRQAGWAIDYARWTPPQGERPALPARIEAVRDDAKVRLIVDAWDFAAMSATPAADAGKPR